MPHSRIFQVIKQDYSLEFFSKMMFSQIYENSETVKLTQKN